MRVVLLMLSLVVCLEAPVSAFTGRAAFSYKDCAPETATSFGPAVSGSCVRIHQQAFATITCLRNGNATVFPILDETAAESEQQRCSYNVSLYGPDYPQRVTSTIRADGTCQIIPFNSGQMPILVDCTHDTTSHATARVTTSIMAVLVAAVGALFTMLAA